MPNGLEEELRIITNNIQYIESQIEYYELNLIELRKQRDKILKELKL